MQLVSVGFQALGDNEFLLEKKITATVAKVWACLVQHCNENSIFFLLWVLSPAFGPYCTQTLKLVTAVGRTKKLRVRKSWCMRARQRLCTVLDLSAKCWMSFRAFKVAQASQLFPTSNYDVRVSITFLTSLNLRYMLRIRNILQLHCLFGWCIAKLFFFQRISIKFKTDRVPFYTCCHPYILSW